MKGTNAVQLIGYVGNHLRVFKKEKSKKVMIRVATHERYSDTNGKEIEFTMWHDVAVWGTLADVAETLFVKGSHILVQGRLVHRTYNDQVGHKRFVTEVNAEILVNLDR